MVRSTTFLARATYRRRRLIDALRVMPAIGALLFLLPILGAGTMERSTAWTGIYLFAGWFLLIVATNVIVRNLARSPGGVGSDPLETPASEDES
ncbi:hypothetical protein [Maritimibacter dapengensis]|uniref:Uncharacterized protein n=1 Tax=Maritimibacter dapengensis TaxID=2836868 RepID=A0ABS6SYK8_9RHOB|nr:hypothetical protein [Maritimibacter dapengensis]MBV7378053.1 hypothetical protein [Maritimibacter dapengensis]